MKRVAFEFRPMTEMGSFDWRSRIPMGFEVRRMDFRLAKQLQADLIAAANPDWFEQLWGGIDNFLEHGFGFAAIDENGIASNCRACWIKDGKVPIQVSTRMFAREQGLATAVCGAFIEHCLTNGLVPEYECDEDNLASISLAETLGFVRVRVD